MGIKIDAQLNSDNKYVKTIRQMADILVNRATSPLKGHEMFYILSLDHIKEALLLRTLHGTTERVIKNRRKELDRLNESNVNDAVDDFGLKKRTPFLDTLIRGTINGVPLSDSDIREEVDTFMFEV